MKHAVKKTGGGGRRKKTASPPAAAGDPEAGDGEGAADGEQQREQQREQQGSQGSPAGSPAGLGERAMDAGAEAADAYVADAELAQRVGRSGAPLEDVSW